MFDEESSQGLHSASRRVPEPGDERPALLRAQPHLAQPTREREKSRRAATIMLHTEI